MPSQPSQMPLSELPENESAPASAAPSPTVAVAAPRARPLRLVVLLLGILVVFGVILMGVMWLKQRELHSVPSRMPHAVAGQPHAIPLSSKPMSMPPFHPAPAASGPSTALLPPPVATGNAPVALLPAPAASVVPPVQSPPLPATTLPMASLLAPPAAATSPGSTPSAPPAAVGTVVRPEAAMTVIPAVVPASHTPAAAATPAPRATSPSLLAEVMQRLKDLAATTAHGFGLVDDRLDHQQHEIDALRAMIMGHQRRVVSVAPPRASRGPRPPPSNGNWIRVIAPNPAHVVAAPAAGFQTVAVTSVPAASPAPAPAVQHPLPPIAPVPPPCTVSAVVPGRVWLEHADGRFVTYGVGDTLPNGQTVTAISAAGEIRTDAGIWACRG